MAHFIQSAGDGSTSADHIGVVGQGLKGVEALTLDYKVGWPLSIVLSRSVPLVPRFPHFLHAGVMLINSSSMCNFFICGFCNQVF